MNTAELDRALRALKRDRANAWDGRTRGGAPHKPLVLLALCDVAETGRLTAPFVPFDGSAFEALGRSFQSLWRALYEDRPGSMWMPLWHLRTDEFWRPRARDGSSRLDSSPAGMAKLRERCSGAAIDAELHRRLLDPVAREELRALLLGAYFDEPTRAELARRIAWNRAASRYGRELLDLGRAGRLETAADAAALLVHEPEPVRSEAFRFAVLEAYEHRCAACGLRLRTPDGLTAVQAAHIHPWSFSHDDRVNNGLGLCATCHWCFDRFLWSVGPSLAIEVSPVLHWERNLPVHLATLGSRRLTVPAEPPLAPDPESLRWHREQWRASP